MIARRRSRVRFTVVVTIVQHRRHARGRVLQWRTRRIPVPGRRNRIDRWGLLRVRRGCRQNLYKHRNLNAPQPRRVCGRTRVVHPTRATYDPTRWFVVIALRARGQRDRIAKTWCTVWFVISVHWLLISYPGEIARLQTPRDACVSERTIFSV